MMASLMQMRPEASAQLSVFFGVCVRVFLFFSSDSIWVKDYDARGKVSQHGWRASVALTHGFVPM